MDTFTIFTWILTSVTIFGTYLNSRQNKYGFLIWGICNMLWLSVDFTRGIYAQAALYSVFIGFNIYGWMQWNKKESGIEEQNVIGKKLSVYREQDPAKRWDTTYERIR